MRARSVALIVQGLTEDQVVKADPLKDLNETWGKGFISGEALTRTAYKSLKG